MKFWPLIWYLLLLQGVHCPGYDDNGITVGLISDKNAEELKGTFDHAIEVVNKDLNVPFVGVQKVIDVGDTLYAYHHLCEMMQSGIGAIFGPTSLQTSAHLSTICDAKEVPYIHSQIKEEADSLNLHPHPLALAAAINAIIAEFGWTSFVFLYESSHYLPILDGIMSNDGPLINIQRYDLQLNGNYKPVLRRVRKSIDNRIVVVGSTASVAELLKQAQQIGIINEKYSYIVGSLDFHTFDLEDYKYSEANMTSFRLFSPEKQEVKDLINALYSNIEEHDDDGDDGDDERDEQEDIDDSEHDGSCPITVEMALLYDSMIVLGKSSSYLLYLPQSLDCSEKSDNVQVHGSTFKNYMHSVDISENTITGRIYFEGTVRKGYIFDVIELQSTGVVKIGTWDELNSFIINRPQITESPKENAENSMLNQTFRVLLSVGNKPYASLVDSETQLYGNKQYEGYCVDLIMELANILGFNFTLINGGTNYGSFNRTTNVTTGMLKEIVEGRADLAMTDLTITADRAEAVDFSNPIMNLGISVLFVKPHKAPPQLFSFMDPFARSVWVYLGLAYVGVTLSFFILGRLSPSEWDNPCPCIEEPEHLENQFTINNSMWFTTGALLQQGSEIAPKSLSTRTVASIWWFFILIIVSSYTANLAAFLTVEKPSGLIDSVNDLAENKGGVKYGAKKEGATRNFFLTTENPIYMKMNEYMLSNPDMLTISNEEGVKRVKDSHDYAFLMESTTIEYNIVRECNLMKIGEPLDEKGYGIAMPKNWPYRDKFNHALLELQEQGVLAEIKNKWWNEVDAGVCDKSADSGGEASPLGLDNLGGVYCVLLAGSGFSILYALVLWLRNIYIKAKRYKASFRAALLEETKIALDFGNNEIVVKSAMSVYSRSRNSSISIESMESANADEDEDMDHVNNEN